jgi:leucyl-tRNA synthetase
MSKSRGNVQTPDEYVTRYGADTLRLFMMFMGPWVDGADWNASGIEGVHRFLRRVWELALTDPEGAGARDIDVDGVVQRTIKKVTEDLTGEHFNTAVAAMMELANTLQHASGPSRNDGVATLILLLAPFAPHLTEELWHRRSGAGSVHQQNWPAYDEAVAAPREVTIVVQVDGKVRDRLPMPAGRPDAEVERAALASPKVKAALDGTKPAKVIVVRDRIVSIVTK